MTEQRIEISVANRDEDALERCRELIDEVKKQQDAFLTIGGEISGQGPVWHFTWMSRGGREGVLHWLSRELDRIEPDWPKLLTLG